MLLLGNNQSEQMLFENIKIESSQIKRGRESNKREGRGRRDETQTIKKLGHLLINK